MDDKHEQKKADDTKSTEGDEQNKADDVKSIGNSEHGKADDAKSIGKSEHDKVDDTKSIGKHEPEEDANINEIEEQEHQHQQLENEDEDDYGIDDSFSPEDEPWMIAEKENEEDEDEEEESEGYSTEDSQEDNDEEVDDKWSSTDEEGDEDVEEEEVIEEEDEDMILLRLDLINNYLLKKALLKYLKKKNAYLQDRIYRTSVRKGLIKEEDMEHENKSKKPKKEKKFKRKVHVEEDEEEEEQIEDLQAEKDKKKHTRSQGDWDDDAKSLKIKKIIEEGALTVQNLQAQLKEKTKLQKTFGETFTMEAKYQKVVKKIIRLLENVKLYEKHHIVNLEKHSLRREEWHVAHKKQLQALLMRVQHASEDAKDSLSGKRMSPIDTQNFCTEMTYIHQKLCATMIRMYKYRRGLELSLKRLDESEVQAEGLQMFEYEQLRSENQTLKDRLNDRLKDVDNIKGKITHCLQILAHFRAKMFDITKLIEEGTEELEEINSNVYASRELTDKTVRKYERLKLGEQKLLVESGLLDNAVLLRDFEKTHFDVVSQNDLKRKLTREYESGLREIIEIKERVLEIQSEYPAVLSTPDELSRRRRSQERQDFLFHNRDGATKCYIPDPPEYPVDFELPISPP